MAKLKVLYHVPMEVVGGAEIQLKYLIDTAENIEPIITYQYDSVQKFVQSLGALKHRQVKNYHQLACAINEYKPDIVQFFHAGMMYLALKSVKKTFKTIEIIHNRHHFPGDATCYPKDQTDFLVFVSQDAKDNYFERQPMMSHSIVANGVDENRFNKSVREYYKPKSPPIFGFHGRLESGVSKGIMQLFELFKGRKDCRLHLVGQDLGRWEAMSREFPHITVYPETNEPEKYLARWDYFISRSPMEGFGLSIAEAVQTGIPSLVFDCGGIVRNLKDHEGVRIATTDQELKSFVDKIVTDPDQLEISNADYDFSARKMTKQYEKLYKLLHNNEVDTRKVEQPTAYRHTDGPVKVLSTCPTDWAGVRKSLLSCSDAYVGIDQVVSNAKLLRPHTVMFAGMHPAWRVLVFDVRPFCKQIVVSLQGMPMLHDFHVANLDALKTTYELLELGAIDKVVTPCPEWASVLVSLGIPAHHVQNTLKDPGLREQRKDSFHIGVFGTNQPWKNLTTQVLGAHMYAHKYAPKPSVEIHTQLNLGIPMFQKMGVKVTEYGRMAEPMFLGLSGSMNINLAVNLTDTFGYNCVESFLMGVPCLFSPMTSAMESAPSELRDACMISNIHSPEAIADGIERVTSVYTSIRELGREFCLKYISTTQGGER